MASEYEQKLRTADVLVEQGSIAGIEGFIEPVGDMEVIDCTGKILLPGFFDMHVHLREPGREDKETIESGSEAAINGGVTGLLAMPNTTPAIDTAGMVRFVQTLAREKARIPVYTSGCITRERAGKKLAEIADMQAKGAIMITDDGSPVSDPYLLRRAMEYARQFNLPVASHCEVMELSGVGAMNEGRMSYKLGIPGIPACSEEICIGRDLRLAQYTGAHLHIQHVTTGAGAELIRRFKEEDTRVTCEVTPHHLIFSEEDIQEYDTHLKMNPPLRTPEDKERLLEGLKSGVIDVLTTDHAPHTRFEKNFDFTRAPFGITGLETALLSMFTYFIKPGRIDWQLLVKAYSGEPRRILNMESAELKAGRPAEFLVFDPNVRTVISTRFMKSKSINTPFLNKELEGSVEKVIRGDVMLLDRIQSEPANLMTTPSQVTA